MERRQENVGVVILSKVTTQEENEVKKSEKGKKRTLKKHKKNKKNFTRNGM